MGLMDRAVRRNVTVTAMVVTTSMVFVIKAVHQAGRETTVNYVMYIYKTL